MRSLTLLVERTANGQTARFERFAADMLYNIATGGHIDTNKVERFGRQLEEVYRNPFERKVQGPQTAAEIKQYLLDKLEDMINGFDDASGEDHA